MYVTGAHELAVTTTLRRSQSASAGAGFPDISGEVKEELGCRALTRMVYTLIDLSHSSSNVLVSLADLMGFPLTLGRMVASLVAPCRAARD
jgi:hypothetical protein